MFTEGLPWVLNIVGTPSSAMCVVPTTICHLSFHRFKNFNSTNLHGTQTEAIIQISTWSLNSFSVFFNFDPTPPLLLHWKGPRQQPSKWGRQNRPPLFTFVLSALYWGKSLKRRTKLWKAAACLLTSHPPSKHQKTLGRTPFTVLSYLKV